MIKKLAALGIISALAFAPVLSYAEDAAPAAGADAAKTDTMAKPAAKSMKKSTHKHKTMHKSSKKMAPKPMATPTETPKS